VPFVLLSRACSTRCALVEWTCVAAVAPYLDAGERKVGTRIEMNHLAATPIGRRDR
jgi:fluoroacetyl-CoA thioesterase